LTSLLFGVSAFLFSADISLTAQGTANFYNPDASSSTVRANLAVVQASVVLLLSANVLLLGILGLFHHRCSKSGVFFEDANKRIKPLIFMLFGLGVLILLRNLFRTVQIFSSADDLIWRREVFFWVFDALPSLVCMLILNALHPTKFVTT